MFLENGISKKYWTIGQDIKIIRNKKNECFLAQIQTFIMKTKGYGIFYIV